MFPVGSTSPPPATESSRAESSRVVPQTPEAEDTVRRFFALPLDTVVEVGKRLGGSPSLKRLMDLGERARVRTSRCPLSAFPRLQL